VNTKRSRRTELRNLQEERDKIDTRVRQPGVQSEETAGAKSPEGRRIGPAILGGVPSVCDA